MSHSLAIPFHPAWAFPACIAAMLAVAACAPASPDFVQSMPYQPIGNTNIGVFTTPDVINR